MKVRINWENPRINQPGTIWSRFYRNYPKFVNVYMNAEIVQYDGYHKYKVTLPEELFGKSDIRIFSNDLFITKKESHDKNFAHKIENILCE